MRAPRTRSIVPLSLALLVGCSGSKDQPDRPGAPTKAAATVPGSSADAAAAATPEKPTELELTIGQGAEGQALRGADSHAMSCSASLGGKASPNRFAACGGDFRVDKASLKLHLELTCPACRSVEIVGSGQAVPFQAGKAKLAVDLRELLGDVRTDDDFTSAGRPITLFLHLDTALGKETATVGFSDQALAPLLRGVEQGPVKFRRDRKLYKGKYISALTIGDYGTLRIGAPVKVRELDLVAIVTATTREVGTCKYVNTATGETKDLPQQVTEVSVTAYERRTGKRVATRQLASRKLPCEERVTASTAAQGGTVSDEALHGWIEKLLAPNWKLLAAEIDQADTDGKDVGWEEVDESADTTATAPALAALAGGLAEFTTLAGLKRGDGIAEMKARLGEPESQKEDPGDGYPPYTLFFYAGGELTVTAAKADGHLQTVRLSANGVAWLAGRGIQDERLSLVGQKEADIVARLGKGTKGEDRIDYMTSDSPPLMLAIELDKGRCRELSVTW